MSRGVLRVAVCASGEGSTFAALADACASGRCPAQVVLLIASRAEAGALAAARAREIDAVVLDQRALGEPRCDEAMAERLRADAVELVVLAGYLRRIGPGTLRAYAGRILNTHPAPLPRFGGQGMYGTAVHEAVLASGVTESAATLHLVDADYDTGPVIASRAVPVESGDDVASLRERVQLAERELLIETIGRWPVRPRGEADAGELSESDETARPA